METKQYLEAITRESDAFADAAIAAGLDTTVPSCPDWTVDDLVRHLASGDLWARTIVERRATERVKAEPPDDAPAGEALVAWFRDGAHALVDVLASTDPATPVWTFGSDRTVAFWRRRRALESAVHRYDAQLAAGSPEPIEAQLAADGVDEFLGVFVPRWGKEVAAGGETLHFHCTDVEGEWLVSRDDQGVRVTREHAKGDVAARGPASDLMLFVWGRVPASQLEVFGDATLLDRFRTASRI